MAKIVFQTEPIENFYDIREELGRGNFAVVKRCKNKENGAECAAKCITKKRSKTSKRGMSKEAVEIEAGVLMALEHKAIIKLYDVFETRTNITLVMELLTGGELFEEIAKEEFIMEKDACFYVQQVLSAIQHMHSQNIVHLDLKPENIVLKYPGSKEIKLIDFGLAKILDPDKELREMLGTPEFSAPEVISYEPVGPFTDMWLSGASPFLGDDDQETYHNITSCDYQFDDEYFEKITENAKDFIRKLLIKKPKERNTIDDCLDHPWIAFEDEENSIINTQKMRAFVARRRWKLMFLPVSTYSGILNTQTESLQSLKLVATISRLKMLYRNSTPSPPPDVSGDEDDNETNESANSNNVKEHEGKLKNFVGSKLFSNVAGGEKDRAECTSENNVPFNTINSQTANENCISDFKERKEAIGEESRGNSNGVVEARSESAEHISSSCEENYLDNVVTSSSIDNSSSSTHEDTSQNSKIEDSDDLSPLDSEKPVVRTTADAGQIQFDGISTGENFSSNSEAEHLNECVPSDAASVAQHNIELLSSEENTTKLRTSFDADCDGQDAMIESHSRLLNGDENIDEDVNVVGLQTVETGGVKGVENHDFLDGSAIDTLKEQKAVLPNERGVSPGCQSDSPEIIHLESHSKEKVNDDRTIIVKQNINKPVVFKLDMNVSQHPEMTGLESVEHTEKTLKENPVSGQYVKRPTGDVLAKSTQDACTVTLSGTSGEKHGKVKAVPEDNTRNENTEVNPDSKRTVVSKAFAKITVNGGKAKQDTNRLQNFSLIKVGIPLATDKALNSVEVKKELCGVPGTREVDVENDDDMVVIEMVEPINNNS